MFIPFLITRPNVCPHTTITGHFFQITPELWFSHPVKSEAFYPKKTTFNQVHRNAGAIFVASILCNASQKAHNKH